MRVIDCGISGSADPPNLGSWEDLSLPGPWSDVVQALTNGPGPRSVQHTALTNGLVFENRRNLIVAAPTNGGKSLIGTLALLEACRSGRRVVLLEPLRALAREKVDELNQHRTTLEKHLKIKLGVVLSTGDYRLEDQKFADPPPATGQFVVATPERLEAILRQPDYNDWVQSIDAICIDEAHLIGDLRRGPVLEYLITAFQCMERPPRLVLQSATLGNLDRLCEWLAPCDIAEAEHRFPVLHKQAVQLEDDETADDLVIRLVEDALSDENASVVVFVYQTRSAERLARAINESVGDPVGPLGAQAYHAQMTADQRIRVRQSIEELKSRCVVTTTALAMGVNLPCTHVIIRDTVFPGVRTLGTGELLQMMGRAGRGSSQGYATVIFRENEMIDERIEAIRCERIPNIESSIVQMQRSWGNGKNSQLASTSSCVAALLARAPEDGLSTTTAEQFFERSLGGQALASGVGSAMSWLGNSENALAYEENGAYHLTVLGLRTVQAVMPLNMGSGIARLLRDLLELDASDRLLHAWKPLDILVVLDLLNPEGPSLRRFSKPLVDQVDGWMESHVDDIPVLYREWLRGTPETSKVVEVLGSLGVDTAEMDAKQSFKMGYTALCRSIVLLERSQGKSVEDLESRWSIQNFAGVEERWRDQQLWLLSGFTKLMDLRCFYYHLKEVCDAETDRTVRVKHLLRKMRWHGLELMEQIKYCSPLGPLLRSIRRVRKTSLGPTIGIQTIRRLENAGITSLKDLVQVQDQDLADMGIRPTFIRQIRDYIRRRLQ